jgi:integrase/recombinase XerD
MPSPPPTSAKVPHKLPQNSPLSSGFLSVAEAAKYLGKSIDTVKRWCESGKLPAFPKAYGAKTTFLIALSTVTAVRDSIEQVRQVDAQFPSGRVSKPHAEFLNAWTQAMQRGLMTGKPFSASTIEMYESYTKLFLASHPAVSYETLHEALLRTAPMEYCKRFKMYKAVVCFAKYLIREKALDRGFLNDVKPLYPKRHMPPKRAGLDETQLQQLMAAANTPFRKMMLVVLAGTGLRVSEAVSLKRSDIDFERQTLTVQRGKGNKTRKLGLSLDVLSAMAVQWGSVSSEWVFCDETGQPLSRMGLYHRLKRLGERAGVKVSPHAMRRAFVTLNANKGRPLQMLQIACGHSDIKTTRDYCLTTEEEVVEAMMKWN